MPRTRRGCRMPNCIRAIRTPPVRTAAAMALGAGPDQSQLRRRLHAVARVAGDDRSHLGRRGVSRAGLSVVWLRGNLRLALVADGPSIFLNCKRDELAIVRNTTEGNNVVCNGLDMKAGEEALLTDQEHPGGRSPWLQKAARFGVRLNYVNLPRPPASADEIVNRFTKRRRRTPKSSCSAISRRPRG